MKKRFILIGLLAAVLVLASTGTALADAGGNGHNCVGAIASGNTGPGLPPMGRELVAPFASAGPGLMGDFITAVVAGCS